MEHKTQLSRREFVKSSAAVVMPMVAGGLMMSKAARAAQPSTLKVGLIGCGGRGTGAVMQALSADPNTVLTAMGDMFPERIENSLGGLTKHFGESAAQRIDVPAERKFT